MLKWPMGLCLHINVSMSITKKKKASRKTSQEASGTKPQFYFLSESNQLLMVV